jgi:hypothetical protein
MILIAKARLPDLKNVDLPGFCSSRHIANLAKLLPVSSEMIESSDQNNDTQGVATSRVLKSEILVESHENVEEGRRFLHQAPVG